MHQRIMPEETEEYFVQLLESVDLYPVETEVTANRQINNKKEI